MPTTAVIVVGLTIVNDVAATPPKLTPVAPVKFWPVIVTVFPNPALVGVKEVTVGGPAKIKPDKDPEPTEVVTTTSPEEPGPTIAVIVVEFTTVKLAAGVPPNVTDVAPVKLLPVIVMVVFVPAVDGEKKLMLG